MADAIESDFRKAPLDDKVRGLLEYADKLAREPATMSAEDTQRLRELGWDDQAISDACQVASYFAYINRIADGLGVDPEPDLD